MPAIELKTTSTALGKTPLSSGICVFAPEMVYVFPLLLTPYANSKPFSPCSSFSTRGKVVVLKKVDCDVGGG